MMNSKLIVFTGGYTAGHVIPNIAIMESLEGSQWQFHYIGSKAGLERDLMQVRGVPYSSIQTGKLRRYANWQTLLAPFQIVMGIVQAFFCLKKQKPKVVFSKGGFVAFPVVVAAWLLRIPVIAHESDVTPGLASRLSLPFVTQLCVSFETALQYYKDKSKVVVVGIPLRKQLFDGDAARGRMLCGFGNDKPCLLVMGGGLGALKINQTLHQILDDVLEKFNVIHLCGRGKADPRFNGKAGYQQFEYVDEHMPDCYAAADLVISRSGANSLYELLALAKPHILIPLSLQASRGDQIVNAQYTQGLGLSRVIDDSALTGDVLLKEIHQASKTLREDADRLRQLDLPNAAEKTCELIAAQGL